MKRIIDLPLATKITDNDYVLVESAENGQEKASASLFKGGGAMLEALDGLYTTGKVDMGMEVTLT